MNSNEFIKWFALGAAAAAGYCVFSVLVGFVQAVIDDIHEQAAALTDIERMNYFPRLRHIPENLRRFATIHNMRLLDVLDLGPDKETGDNYYYLHGQILPGLCVSMLVKQERGGKLHSLSFTNNRVAAALVAKCENYVHNTQLTVMLSMFVARVTASHDRTDSQQESVVDIEQGE